MTSPSPGPAARRGAAAADDPWALNADLHCHSAISDGTLSPEAVVARAHAQGVQMLSLTDHDELAGQAAALETARKLGIAYVPGIEISVTWAGETIHVLGLGIDPDDAALAAGVAGVRDGDGFAPFWPYLNTLSPEHRARALDLIRRYNEGERWTSCQS